MSKKYRVAVLGAGDMANQHVQGWQLAGHEVVSVTDVDLERANTLAEKAGVKQVYSDFTQSIIQPDVDIISIALPLIYHGPATILAANHGKHVFCEKPLASSLEEVERMQAAVEEAGVKFGLGFQRNFAHGVELTSNWVKKGLFGSPMVFNSDLLQEVRPKITMHDKNGNQGPVVDTCCHFFLMWQTVFGSKPKKVYARGGILGKDRQEIAHFEELAIDTAIITIEFESGDIGNMTISWGLAKHTKMRGRADRIIGPKGGAEGYFNTWGTDSGTEVHLFIGDQDETVPLERRVLHQVEFEAFIEALDQGQPVPYGFEQGKEMIKLSYAVLESIETGKVIYV
ncbi:myo-inositol 2-dehydrogenase/D-chiro-inositol 1-dehydrogenase [Bacillus sp. SLBN-46]|uniref:Gfo/Idh/MocA family protein n=1 Tax=Bacillus sp. SLBN-46 TaxID=3042283 RepID=UPI00285E7D5C|nr:Gfo/Idh/MocA family oxidoreductase [Bacillus sp. SLBN-46]MDR6124035.1 myo-inositol 2-dehydrogenase/D-chiro-inositol 1-dehydrogenase [Bacillus sp. SLBN-46]